MGVFGSSSSSSGGAGEVEGAGIGVAVGRRGIAGACCGVGAEMGISAGAGFGASTGVSSTVLCFPVVQGGIAMNSSKVRTRGLQHFQPGWSFVSIACSYRVPWTMVLHLSVPRGRRAKQNNQLFRSTSNYDASSLTGPGW